MIIDKSRDLSLDTTWVLAIDACFPVEEQGVLPSRALFSRPSLIVWGRVRAKVSIFFVCEACDRLTSAP
jgi:hypothetical protein